MRFSRAAAVASSGTPSLVQRTSVGSSLAQSRKMSSPAVTVMLRMGLDPPEILQESYIK